MVRIWNNKNQKLTSDNEVELPYVIENKTEAIKLVEKWVNESKTNPDLKIQKISDYTIKESKKPLKSKRFIFFNF